MEADKKRKTYDREFKVNAVNLVIEGGRKVREVARELGIVLTPESQDIFGRPEIECSGRLVDRFLTRR